MKRILAMVLLLMCAGTACLSEAESFADHEQADRAVALLLRAVVGTDEKNERKLREKMTDAEAEARNGENAAYRALTLPWLLEAVNPEPEDGQSEAELTAEEQSERERLLADACRAFEGNSFGAEYLDFLREAGAGTIEEYMESTRSHLRVWLSEIDAERLREVNPDHQCWLYCQDTLIDYPVVQCADNDTYLHRMFNGEENSAGTIFIDYRNLPGFQDPNTLMYGHHMRNGSMFGNLVKYKDQWYYESHPYFLIISADGVSVCNVIAGYTTRMDDHCYDIAISDEEDFRQFVEEALEKSDFACEPVILSDDRLVTMSTCTYSFQYARYIVIGRLESARYGEDADMELSGDRAE